MQKNTRADWVGTAYSKGLSNRRSRDTEPELLLRRALHRLGLRYRVNTPIGKRLTLDINFARARVAVFVDGHFWHHCERHPRAPSRGPNAALWDEKFRRIDARDTQSTQMLEATGYLVFRFSECEIRENVDALAVRVAMAVKSRRH